jgi:hypothetical protein
MPLFKSKIQHNTYEKGEFSDEQERTLEETITIIKTFPWDEERPLTDVQLTGPSVTIQNEYAEYLKIGLYFNGKFCLYFLDNGNHVYEYHAPDMETACGLVSDYFQGTLDLSRFEKHLLNIGAAKHFISQSFEYRLNKTSFTANYIIICILTLVMLSILALLTSRNGIVGIILIVTVYGLFNLHKGYLNNYLKLKDAYLQLSKGSISFTYGIADHITLYFKTDIKSIYLSNAPSKNDQSAVYDITFNDDTYIRFSGFLIPYSAFVEKFPGIKMDYAANKWPVSL